MSPTGVEAEVVSVWYVVGGGIRTLARSPEAAPLLSDAERERVARFHREEDRDRFVSGRILARFLLSAVTGDPPKEWEIEADPNGRPRLAAPACGLDFNISHTEGLVACAAAHETKVGLDVEARLEMPDLMKIARRFFAVEEVRVLESLSPVERPPVFFAFWTLKEAFVKATGGGLSVPLETFAFDLGSSPPAWSAREGLVPDPDAWGFRLWEPTDRHTMAVAVRTLSGQAFAVEETLVTPDGESGPPWEWPT